jgi:NitT/TauT family transport system substrate-binding protein
VWTVEPWVTRLEREAGAKLYLEESSLWKDTGGKYVTTHLVSSVQFLNKQRDLLKRWIAAHVELTEWIQSNADEAKKLLNEGMKRQTTRALPIETLDPAWKRLEITYDPIRASLLKSAEDAHRIGFIKQKPDLSKIYELGVLNEVLKEMGKGEVR